MNRLSRRFIKQANMNVLSITVRRVILKFHDEKRVPLLIT